MPANFPATPAVNDVYSYSGSTWIWTGVYWQLQNSQLINGVSFTYSNTAPSAANLGDRWLNSDTLQELVLVSDGTSTQWVEIASQAPTGATRNLNNLANVAINTSLVPAANVAYDLGSSSLRWRDLYLSGNSLIIGAATITASGSAIALPVGSTVGNTTFGSGSLTTEDLTVSGNLTVNGTTTTINSTTLSIDDKNIVLADGAANSAAADGAGITVAGATATLTYVSASDTWNVNKNILITPGTANGILYLNASKVATTGSALTFDGTNLGIGTSSPATKLNLENAGACQIQIAYNSTIYGRIGRTSGGNYEFSSYENGSSLTFGTSNSNGSTTTNMTLDRYGNLGLGVAPSAWGNTAKAFTIRSTGSGIEGSISNSGVTNAVSLTSNSYYASGWKYVYSGGSFSAGRYDIEGNTHSWYNAPSGTTGNAISFTQAMTLNASGNLGIGETNPSGRLHVKTTGITASAPGFGWPVYNAEYDTNSRSVYIDTAGNGSVSTAGYGATVALVLGQYYDSRVVITASGNGGASPGDQGTANGKDMLIKAGHSDNGVGYKGGRLYLSGGMGYTSGGYNGNVGNVIIQPFGGDLLVGTTSGLAGGYRLIVNGTAFTQTPTSSDIYQGHTLIIQEQDGTNFVANKSIALGFNMSCGGGFTSHGKIALVKENGTSGNQSTRFEFWTRNGANNGTSDAERLRISSTGSLGAYGSVSVSTGTHTVSDNGSSPHTVRLYNNTDSNNSTNRFLLCDAAASVLRAEIRSNGGFANYSANNANLSDRREKTNFAPAKSYLDAICAIPVQTFNYIDQAEDDPGLTLGVVAQDVQAVAPELVMESNWGTEDNPKMRLSIYQTDLQYALMKALQELKAEFDAYKAAHP